ncbi:hypothetical protein [Glycomyces buryatensis]|uniref:Uncharacterized protein n=1 Tax=Glycomyces buryatensis TaxID=2570927 RepID=A0A4S8QCA7_9ACTN|nr:hypothetical protein [Glycomyces buryatensis]THV41920.1 hypothetical protein FAB82_09390 [Glycomyces buryatensis]
MASLSVRQYPAPTPSRNVPVAGSSTDSTRSRQPERPDDSGSSGLRFLVGFDARPVRPGDPLEYVQGDGFFDWAGRRLFLEDGAPDPDTSGAYRYQHSPDCCDTAAWDGDPVSPRYEPMYLRHRLSDTWIIDTDRPYDPDDPGPFGSSGWRPDRRTGRHRRNELPDPLPPSESDMPVPEYSEVVALSVRRWSEAEVQALHAERDHDDARTPDGGQRANRRRESAGAGTPPPPQTPTPTPTPKDRNRFWPDADRQAGSEDGEAPRFSPLREQAFKRFMTKSADLAAAHHETDPPSFRQRLAHLIAWAWWVACLGLIAAPRPLREEEPPVDGRTAAPRPVPIPVQRGTIASAGPVPQSTPVRYIGTGTITQALAGARRYRADHPEPTRRPRPTADGPRPNPSPRRDFRRDPRSSSASARAPYMAAWERAFDVGPGWAFTASTAGKAAA